MSIWDAINVLLEDSNEDDMTLDADDDGGETTGTEDTQTDDTSITDDTTQDDNTDQQDNQDNTDDNTDTQLDADDDMGDTGDDSSPGEDNGAGTDDTSGDMGDGTGEETIDENDPNAKLKELEKSIFDQLSPEQKTLKTKELKSLFDIVYNKCTDIINTISGAERTPEQAKVYDYIMNSLTDLQKYVKDYLFQIFDSKTYIENMVQLQKYLTVLDTVSNIFEEIKKSSDSENGSV